MLSKLLIHPEDILLGSTDCEYKKANQYFIVHIAIHLNQMLALLAV